MLNGLDIPAVARMALPHLPELAEELLPAGRREGHEYRVGSLAGEPGKSLSINLRTGAWCDFATDERGGDAVSLFAAVRGCSQYEAARELAERHGCHVGEVVPRAAAPRGSRPILPAPEGKPPPFPFRDRELGEATGVWPYHDAEGRLLSFVCRYDRPGGGGKAIKPWCCTDRGWRQMHAPAPRSLYGLDRLAARPDAPVLVVEGERTAEDARVRLPGRVAVTWSGGAKAVGKADWSPLRGRDVVVWPDADGPGREAAAAVARAALAAGAASVRVVVLPEGLPEGWDLADPIPEGLDPAALVEDAVPAAAPEPEPAGGAEPPEGPRSALEGLKTLRDGTPRGNLHNAAVVVRARFGERIAFDELRQAAVAAGPLPWANGGQRRDWTDHDDLALAAHLQEHGLQVSVETAGQAVQLVARKRPFHPVRDYLDGLAWDGVPRLDLWPVTYLGAADSPYVRAVGAKALLAAVARAYRPGCKADNMLVLEGPQGAGKSRAVAVLAGPAFFADHLPEIGSKDAFLQLRGRWFIEAAELAGTRKADVERTKAFLSSREDVYRPPYGRHAVGVPRSCVFVGTVNPDGGGYLRDPTGNRRFWPVAVGRIEVEALARDRDPLWAEAVHRYRADERWWLTAEEEAALAAPEQEARREEDEYEAQVRWFATHEPEFEEEPVGDPEEGRTRRVQPLKITGWAPRQVPLAATAVAEVAAELFGIPPERLDMPRQRRIGTALQAAGYVKDGRPELKGDGTPGKRKWWRLGDTAKAAYQDELLRALKAAEDARRGRPAPRYVEEGCPF